MKEYTLEEIMDAFEECAKQRQDLKEENKQLKKRNKELEDGFKATTDELCEYATKIDKAIEYIKEKQKLNKMFGTITLSKNSQNELLELLGDKENEY